MMCLVAVRMVLLLGLFASLCLGESIHLQTYEEEPPGTVIAVLSEHSIFNSTQKHSTNFRLKQFNSSFIQIRESDGQLSIREKIDREKICRRSHNCVLALDILSFSKDQFKLINVKIEVRDINDHSPHFPSSELHVNISEAASVGTRVPLQMAVDDDIGLNSVQDYMISGNNYFGIDIQTRDDGLKYAELVLMKELDRETEQSYTLDLVANDGGSPALSGSTKIIINVLDFNDNMPIFEKSSITVDLLEDAPAGSLLIDLNAVDHDEGTNGEIVYGFSPLVSNEVRQLFRIDHKTGIVTLIANVDFEAKHSYEFDVVAQDMGPNPLRATCKVIVHIVDVNDNAPIITITPLTSTNQGVAYITEEASKDSFIALIGVVDPDHGQNGQVLCTLLGGHDHFKLQQASEDSFMIVTTSPLDRETVAEYNLTLLAEDCGSPSLKTTKHYTVRVSDINDNSPSFTKSLSEVSVFENNAPGAYITTVVAKDPDLGHNGKVSYRLIDGKILGQSLSTFVVIDYDSGVLRAVRSLDRERLEELNLEIEASDHGEPRLSTSTHLKVKILDRNDNPPLITSPLLDNGATEIMLPIKSPQNYLVFRVHAKDADEGHNAQLIYTMQQDKHKLFTINRATGEVSLRRRIKPTQDMDLSIVVVVYDGGRPSLSCNATIRFILTDAAPSNVEIVAMPEDEEEQQQLDLSIIFIAVLSGGCTLLLVAILCVACSCRHRSEHSKLVAEERRREAEDRLLNSTDLSKESSSSSTASTESCQLSFHTDSENGSMKSSRGHSEDLHSASASSVATPTPDQQQEKTENGTSGHQQEHFSAKDSGRGDSDFNDSASDSSGEGVRKASMIDNQEQTVALYNEKSMPHPGAETRYIHRSNRALYNGHYTIQYQREYAVSYTTSPPYYSTYNPRAPTPHSASDTYYHVRHQPTHSDYEQDFSYRSATLAPPRLYRGPQPRYHSHEKRETATDL